MEKTFPEAVVSQLGSNALRCTLLPQQMQRESCGVEDDAAVSTVRSELARPWPSSNQLRGCGFAVQP